MILTTEDTENTERIFSFSPCPRWVKIFHDMIIPFPLKVSTRGPVVGSPAS
jgi:hypothetical protein